MSELYRLENMELVKVLNKAVMKVIGENYSVDNWLMHHYSVFFDDLRTGISFDIWPVITKYVLSHFSEGLEKSDIESEQLNSVEFMYKIL